MPRITALVLDWAISMVIVVLALGLPALTANDWRRWAVLTAFFLESAALTAITGASAGQLICRITVLRLDGKRLGVPRALLRAAMVCLAIPPLIVGPERRGLHDMAVNTVVVRR
ncbi:MAG TPA: RDD family protein [Candidatus Avipropionibacterium avicola]|uniref:RDD family protein n=1 Tax=Candidatus Avipropionibacterium avicola TaxID=2840701 RepID=A0A9D1H161_9ACTN|nr:RDD family protein [Candidatus Avipropionibacterium avicola]